MKRALPIALLAAFQMHAADYLDLAPFGKLLQDASSIGVQWDEERDVREVRVNYGAGAPSGVAVEYWFRNWPYDPPKMPTIEDPMDDPWQGKWLRAKAAEYCSGGECIYGMEPIEEAENPRAKNLPGVRYRRTLKVRLVFPGSVPAYKSLRVFSDSTEAPIKINVESAEANTSFRVFNGMLRSAKPEGTSGKFVLDVMASHPAPAGSHDITIVTVASPARTFSFSVEDLRNGPIRIPDFHARVALVGQPPQAAAARPSIRQMIPKEPEQTYQRASREIPPLDPWNREWGGALYLPLSADASWQKFAVEYGGNVFISKDNTKAKGHELTRLQWEGDRTEFRIGTGLKPYFREDHKSTARMLEGYLPVAIQTWSSDGLQYEEEAFTTLLSGPLSPDDPARSEQTPAVLMMRFTVKNPGAAAKTARLSLDITPEERLTVEGKRVLASGKIRAEMNGPVAIAGKAAQMDFAVPAGGSSSALIKLPFVTDLNSEQASEMEALDYDAQRTRVADYWRAMQPTARMSVPEPKFMDLLRSVITHIHISVTKDPKSGLYMVPAASYVYSVFANEAAFQSLLLDTLGSTKRSTEYLETLMKLQGSQNFPGLQQGPPDAIFHGARVDDQYNYTASGYGLDHGTVTWVLAEHYLYTRDRAWLEHAWPHLRKAVDWIVEQRATTKHLASDGEKSPDYGLLPASQLEDNSDWANWFAINGYAWAGLDRTAEALKDIGHPDADRIRREADAYREDLRSAVLRASQLSPVVHMRDGSYEPYVPVLPYRRLRLFGPIRMAYYSRYSMPDSKPLLRLGADRETLYGPMILLVLGLFQPDEPIANWILNDWEDNQTLSSGMGMNIHGMTDDKFWFSQGGMVFQANLQNPIQVYLRRHEIPAAIRTLYNDFTACLYPSVNAFTEEFHQWRHGSGPFFKSPDEARFINRLRDVLVREEGGSLWLASGAPRRWLESKEGIRVDRVLTYFGEVSYSMHAGEKAGTVEATVQLPTRSAPNSAWLVARTPSGHIESVTLNGRPWTKIDRKLEAIELPRESGTLKLEIRYR